MTQVQQLPQLPETVEEQQENVPDDDRHHSVRAAGELEDGRGLELYEEDDQLRQIEEDLQSELSFTSAYSHPRDSPKTLQRMETTV